MRNMNLLKTAAHSFLKKLHKGKKKRHQPIFLFATDGTKKAPKGTHGKKEISVTDLFFPSNFFSVLAVLFTYLCLNVLP